MKERKKENFALSPAITAPTLFPKAIPAPSLLQKASTEQVFQALGRPTAVFPFAASDLRERKRLFGFSPKKIIPAFFER